MQHTKSLYAKGLVHDRSMLTQSQFSQVQFSAQLDNIKLFHNALKSIHFHDDVTISLSANGLKACVEEARYVQATVYVTRACFSEFRLQTTDAEPELKISVNLSVVCDCLSIFTGVECSMRMLYKGAGAPLVFVLEQHGLDDLVTECSIRTRNADEQMEFGLDTADAAFNSIIVRGAEFANLLGEVNRSAEELELHMSPQAPFFRMTTLGVVQSESHVEVSRSSDMVLMFACRRTSTVRYKMSHVRMTLRALALAAKVALRTDSSGVLGMQMMVLAGGEQAEAAGGGGGGAQIYVEYFVMPLLDVGDY